MKYVEAYFEGLVITIAFVVLVAVLYGAVALLIHEPDIMVPIAVLIIVPAFIGFMRMEDE